jgi:hypothetical protein
MLYTGALKILGVLIRNCYMGGIRSHQQCQLRLSTVLWKDSSRTAKASIEGLATEQT